MALFIMKFLLIVQNYCNCQTKNIVIKLWFYVDTGHVILAKLFLNKRSKTYFFVITKIMFDPHLHVWKGVLVGHIMY